MVLDHVANYAGGLVVVAAVLDADRLGDQHLHVVDVPPVPDRLEEAIREAEDHMFLPIEFVQEPYRCLGRP